MTTMMKLYCEANTTESIAAGASASYARTIDFKRFREIADECGEHI